MLWISSGGTVLPNRGGRRAGLERRLGSNPSYAMDRARVAPRRARSRQYTLALGSTSPANVYWYHAPTPTSPDLPPTRTRVGSAPAGTPASAPARTPCAISSREPQARADERRSTPSPTASAPTTASPAGSTPTAAKAAATPATAKAAGMETAAMEAATAKAATRGSTGWRDRDRRGCN
jgi:hypothetical protein